MRESYEADEDWELSERAAEAYAAGAVTQALVTEPSGLSARPTPAAEVLGKTVLGDEERRIVVNSGSSLLLSWLC